MSVLSKHLVKVKQNVWSKFQGPEDKLNALPKLTHFLYDVESWCPELVRNDPTLWVRK